MSTKIIFMLTLVLTGILFLSACVTEIPATSPEEAPVLVKTEEPNPYPYPAPVEDFVNPNDPTEPYPEPEAIIIVDPYPGVDDSDQVSGSDIVLIVDGFSPVSADKNFNRGPVFLDSTDIRLKESYPVQVELVLTGNLPTPCHQLRIVAADPDEDGHIDVEVYSVSDPEKMCIQVLEPFEATIPLGDYSEGNYTISINEEPAVQFNLP